jgi:hypothetical protein
MKTAVQQTKALRYKLCMFGIPIAGPANVFCDNDSAVANCMKPESTINKKQNAIAYHKVREGVVVGIIRVAWEASNTNLADLLTKPLKASALQRLCVCIYFTSFPMFKPHRGMFPGSISEGTSLMDFKELLNLEDKM